MLNIKDAKDILNYYGFISTSVEPTLCQNKNDIGIFTTFKTKYGHLSRFVKFETKQKMKDFLAVYLWYRKNINNDKLNVEFDNYENLSPKIKFIFNNIEVTSSNLNDIKISDSKVEELVIDTTLEDNMELLNIVFEKIKTTLKGIDKFQNDLEDILLEYQEKLKQYNRFVGNNKDIKVTLNKINTEKYYSELNRILTSYNSDTKESFSNYFSESLKLYEEVLLNENYLNNVYLFEYYKEQIRVINLKISLYKKYVQEINNKKNKLFKSKKDQITFEDYLNNSDIEEHYINKEEIIFNEKTKSENSLIQLKNNSIEELKLIFKIVIPNSKKEEEKTEKINIIDVESLKYYFMSISKHDRNNILVLSSPLKELINLIISIDTKDIKNAILSEKYYKNKFEEMYEILSSQDNYAATRKYLKILKLDSLEEFVDSLIEYVSNFEITPFALPKNTILKFKIGVLLNQGYINASINDEYPINSKGINNYCLANNIVDIKAYYSPYILRLDEFNILSAVENNNIITFNLENLKFVKKSELKVNNYILKKRKGEYNFLIFNEKIYVDTTIDSEIENGDINE